MLRGWILLGDIGLFDAVIVSKTTALRKYHYDPYSN